MRHARPASTVVSRHSGPPRLARAAAAGELPSDIATALAQTDAGRDLLADWSAEAEAVAEIEAAIAELRPRLAAAIESATDATAAAEAESGRKSTPDEVAAHFSEADDLQIEMNALQDELAMAMQALAAVEQEILAHIDAPAAA